MAKQKTDHELGLGSHITRRDFMDGVAFTVAAAAAAPVMGSAAYASTVRPAAEAAKDPPMRTGFRGFNVEAMNAGHAVRDGLLSGEGTDTGEVYDLVIVGAGMSGLASAYYYRKHIPNAKILLLEACDDFGGHARRNEFSVDGKQVIGFGGVEGLWRPNTFPPECQQLMKDIGIVEERYYKHTENEPNALRDLGLRPGVFFDKETFGVDKLMTDYPGGTGGWGQTGAQPKQTWAEFLPKAPYPPKIKAGLIELYTTKVDYMPGLSVEEKVSRLKAMSYADYLQNVVKLNAETMTWLVEKGAFSMINNKVTGPDTCSAWYAFRYGNIGFDGLNLPPVAKRVSNVFKDVTPNIFFPDGNGGVARLMVRWLIPDALPGSTMEDSLVPRLKYETLDRPENDVRIRLNSAAVRVKHLGDPLAAKEVEVTYARDGKLHRVRAGSVVMACFNAIVPYLCPELPEAQKTALHNAVRLPLVVVNVAVRNWRAFQKLGVSGVNCPGMFSGTITPIIKPSFGGSNPVPKSPDDPIILFMNMHPRELTMPGSGLPPRDRWRAARAQLQAIPFETFERNIRRQLDRVLSPGGFDVRRDIAGITINRWGHGYATGSNSMFDPDYTHRTDAPWIVGRQRFGRIAIANSDAAAVCLTQAAWQQGHRAVTEIITDIVRPVFDMSEAETDFAGEPGDNPLQY